MAKDTLGKIHSDIEACYACMDSLSFEKPKPMIRGGKSALMIIGQGPGKTELSSGQAFSGQSGKRLNQWLVEAGAKQGAPRENVYLTSAIKCVSNSSDYQGMVTNCRNFLIRQISTVRPALIWSLGSHAYKALNVSKNSYDEAIFNCFDSSNGALLYEWTGDPIIIPMPHPSGANRMLNSESTQTKLRMAIALSKVILAKRGISL